MYLGLVGIVCSPVVQVVAEAGHEEAKHLKIVHEPKNPVVNVLLEGLSDDG